MMYFATLRNIVVLGLVPAFFVFPTKSLVNVICPPNLTYLEKRNSCAFFIDSYGNFSNSRQRCTDENAYLINSITNGEIWNELCKFAKTRMTNEASFYLDAYKNKNSFQWALNNSRIEEDEGHACLEMVVSEPDCFLKDVPCDELKWHLCEVRHANPCVYNKGGCEGECIPRHTGVRKCVCPLGTKIVVTSCRRCYDQFTYNPNENRCIWVMDDQVLKIEENKKKCEDVLSQSNNQTAVLNTRPALPIIENQTSMDNYCSHIRKEDDHYVGGTFDGGTTQQFSWLEAMIMPKSRLCVEKITIEKLPDEDYCIAIYKNVTTEECCMNPTYCKYTNGFLRYGICQTPPVLFTHADTSHQETCYWDNGGCLHECVILFNGGRKCMCWQGFELVNDTECRYKDRCLGNAGKPGCPLPNRTWEIEKGNKNKTKTSLRKETADSNFVILVIVGCLIFLVCCHMLFLCTRRICRKTDVAQSSIE